MKRILLYGLLLLSMSIQAQELLPYPTDTVDGKVYYRYTVEKSIGLYRISKNFGVSQEAILEANPELRNRGLRYEEVIRIPTNLPAKPKVDKPAPKQVNPFVLPAQPKVVAPKDSVIAVKNAIAMETAKAVDTVTIEQAVIAEDTLIAADTVLYTDTIRLAFLLPLQAELAQRSPTIDRFYDYYTGALLAIKHHDPTYIDSLGNQHTTYYDIHTYDMGKLGKMACQLVDSNMLADMDAIIGAAYLNQIQVISPYAQDHEIPVMVAFPPQFVPAIWSNPYLLKFNPCEQIHTHALMEHLDTLRSEINMVLVDAYADKMDYSASIRGLRDSIAARHLPVTHTTIRQILADSVSAALKDSVDNIIVFHSERYSNIQLLMPYLLSGKHGKRLTLYSQYAWQSERILLPQLYTTVFRTPDSEAIARYEQDRALYFGHTLSSTLPRYDLLGYDQTMYMLRALQGGTFSTQDTLYEGLQSSMLFTPNEHGGYENTYITIHRQ